jgi:DNA primase
MRYESLIRSTFQVVSQSGKEVLCVCPWHADSAQGHLYVNAINGLFLCMSCGTKGKVDKLSGIDLPRTTTADLRERLRTMTEPRRETVYYPERWLGRFDIPHPFWTEERGLPEDVVKQFRLGFDFESNRATLPLRDMFGRILGVTYRRLDGGTPKYLHPKGFPIGKHLYGAWLLKEQRTVALTEGQVDTIRNWSNRIPSVAMMGARLTADQTKVLQKMGVRKVVLMLDNDNSGRKGTIGVYDALRGSGIQVVSGWYRPYWVKQTEDGMRPIKDPDELSAARARKMFHSAIPILDWVDRSGFHPHG